MRLSIDLPSGRALVTEVDEAHTARGRELLGRLVASAARLADGGKVDVDLAWATVRLRATADEVVAEEPDYSHDPSRFTPSLAVTSRIFDTQRPVLQTVGVDGEPVTESGASACRSTRCVLPRWSAIATGTSRRHSAAGELISAGSGADDDMCGLYAVRELAAHRPVWIVAMLLPAGWSFRCVGSTLVDGVSPPGRTYGFLASVDV